MSAASLTAHQLRYDQKIFWRNPASVGFTVLLPVMLLVLLDLIVNGHTIHALGGIEATTYYVPAVITFAVVSATTVNLAMNLTILREVGILKRLRGTPLPSWVFIAGRIGNAIVVATLVFVAVSAIGAVAFGVDFPWSRLPALLVSLAVGSAAFCALGVALTALIPSREAAPAVTNLIVFPLYFLSGIFVPESEIPNGVLHVADLFPIRHLFDALLQGFDPATSGAGFDWGSLAILAAWGVAGLLVAMRSFRWEPRASGT
jgi:ABC-2 type transport system permease protein